MKVDWRFYLKSIGGLLLLLVPILLILMAWFDSGFWFKCLITDIAGIVIVLLFDEPNEDSSNDGKLYSEDKF